MPAEKGVRGYDGRVLAKKAATDLPTFGCEVAALSVIQAESLGAELFL